MNALLERPELRRVAERQGRAAAVAAAQVALEEVRSGLDSAGTAPGREELLARAGRLAALRAEEAGTSTLRRVVNATGVVLHTNLGRAPLARSAAEAAARAAQGYVALEYDVARGDRGSRHRHGESLLRELTGAEGALVVNNGAAALLLALNTAAEGRSVLVSRGEMIEIGGGFRIHEILAKSGARLVEVGATNKTHLADYARALDVLGREVGAILKVHRSNFVQSGFVAEVGVRELADLVRGRQRCSGAGARSTTEAGADEVALVYDLGSGCLEDLRPLGLPPEPTARDALADGADLVGFSGDKLLGGPQAGILLGRGPWIDRARTNPLARALRVDKLTLAALEETLRLHRDPARLREIPGLGLLGRSTAELRRAADRLVAGVAGVAGLQTEIVETTSRVGGGSLPGAELPGVAAVLRHGAMDAATLEARLRAGSPPVVARVAEGRVLLELRAVPEDELALLTRLVRVALGESG